MNGWILCATNRQIINHKNYMLKRFACVSVCLSSNIFMIKDKQDAKTKNKERKFTRFCLLFPCSNLNGTCVQAWNIK